MTTAAICATREVSWGSSFYRGEQYDSDLGLYYLRARYYNPNTGRFLSRDPEDGKAKIPASLHKYLYAGGDPVNARDPRGREDLIEYAAVAVHSALEATIYGTHVRKCLVKAYSEIDALLSAILSDTPTDLTGEGIGLSLAQGVNAATYDLATGVIVSHIFPYPGMDCE